MEVDTLFKHLFSSQSNNLDPFGAVSFVIYETKFLLVKTWEKIISSFTFFVSRKYGRKEYKDGIPFKNIDLITSNLWHGLHHSLFGFWCDVASWSVWLRAIQEVNGSARTVRQNPFRGKCNRRSSHYRTGHPTSNGYGQTGARRFAGWNLLKIW